MDRQADANEPCGSTHGATGWPFGTSHPSVEAAICGNCKHLIVNVRMPTDKSIAHRHFDLGPWNDILKEWDKNWGTNMAENTP